MIFATLILAAAAAGQTPAIASATQVEMTATAPAGHTMAGEILLPPGNDPVPVVMLISGTGRQSRDFEMIDGKYHPHRDLAEALLAAGIGVIRFDERNTGRSTGDHRTASAGDLQADARLLFDLAARDPRVDRRHMFIFGHSEGSVFAMRLAASDSNVAGIAISGAPFNTGREIMREQVRVETPRDAAMSDAQWEAAVAEAYAKEIAFHETRPSLADMLDYDGAATAGAVTRPALILEAGADWQITPPQGRQLAQAMLAAGNPSVTYRFLPQVNHLMTANPEGVTDYKLLQNLSVSPLLIRALIAWVREHAEAPLESKNPAR